MSQDTDLQSNYSMSQLDAHAAAMFLLRRELLVYPENEGPVGINPVLPSIRPNLFEDVKFVGDNASHLRKALRCFMEKQGKDFDPDTDVLEALVLAASKHLFPSPPPKGTRGHPRKAKFSDSPKLRNIL